MARRLRIKFVAIAMVTLAFITFVIIGIIRFDNDIRVKRQIDEIINLILENNGKIPDYNAEQKYISDSIFYPETKYVTRYFIIKHHSGDYEEDSFDVDLSNITSINREEAIEIYKKTVKSYGTIDNYRYKCRFKDGVITGVFIDCTTHFKNLKLYNSKSLVIVWIGLTAVLAVSLIFSKYVVDPIIEAINKQKEFISNASHDLKTPVAIMLADAEVLELEVGEDNEYIISIKNQVRRLDSLIKTLIALTKLGEKNYKLNIAKFCLNDCINEEITNLKPLLKDKKIVFDSNEKVMINADENAIRQLIIILFDNAIKYANDNSDIKVNVAKQGRNARLEVVNYFFGADKINTDKIFERFYRQDLSRNSKKQGSGIGLSMAKTIVNLHKGKIFAKAINENEICFTVII